MYNSNNFAFSKDKIFGAKNHANITREEISKLLWGMINDISTHSLSMWLKSKTDDEFVVVPREFCVLVVSFLERQVPQKEHLLFNSQNVLGQLEEIKRYL